MQYGILSRCYSGEANTVTALAQVLPVDSPAVSRHVDRLHAKGLIRRQRLQNDRRRVRLHLTKEGLDLMPKLSQRIQANNSAIWKGISEEDRISYMRMTQEMIANLAEDQRQPRERLD